MRQQQGGELLHYQVIVEVHFMERKKPKRLKNNRLGIILDRLVQSFVYIETVRLSIKFLVYTLCTA